MLFVLNLTMIQTPISATKLISVLSLGCRILNKLKKLFNVLNSLAYGILRFCLSSLHSVRCSLRTIS